MTKSPEAPETRQLLDFGVDVSVESVPVGDSANGAAQDLLAAGTFDVVNGFAMATALFALFESPLLAPLEEHGCIDIKSEVKSHNLNHRHSIGLLRYLTTQGLFHEQIGEVFRLTPKGTASLSRVAKGWVRMVVGGYGELMVNAGKLLTGEFTFGDDISRNLFMVADGSTQVSSSLHDEVPFRVVERYQAKVLADIGCGTGKLLQTWASRSPDHRGVGIDISPDAIKNATEHAKAMGLDGQLEFVVADGFATEEFQDACKDVDIFYSFALEHELMARGEDMVIKHLDHLGRLFPGKRYLMGEPMLNMTVGDGQFYWLHVLSHQGFPRNIPRWCELLRKAELATLERVYVPEHQKIGAFFDISLG